MEAIFCIPTVFLLLFFYAHGNKYLSEDCDECHCDVRKKANVSMSIVGRYARYDEILNWMDELCCLYPEIAQTYDIGRTSEGRSMVVLQLGFRRSPGVWGVWLDGGIHAREHIAPATVIYIAHELVEGYRLQDAGVVRMLETINWYFLPVFNPDGYEFSHTQSRLWRKNRRRVNDYCVGVDLNRNWGVDWGGADADDDPCSDHYAGDGPATEPEVRNTMDFLLPRASEMIAFLTYHSFGQKIFTRWDYTKFQVPEDHDELTNLAIKVSDAIAEFDGRDYKVGQAPVISYAYGGGSADWAKAVAGIKYSYLIELRDTGIYGFRLPKEEVIPTGKENWAGVKEIGWHIIRNHPPRNSTKHSGDVHKLLPRRCGNPKASLFVESERSGANTWTRAVSYLGNIASIGLVYLAREYVI